MIDPSHALPMMWQAKQLGIHRRSIYYLFSASTGSPAATLLRGPLGREGVKAGRPELLRWDRQLLTQLKGTGLRLRSLSDVESSRPP